MREYEVNRFDDSFLTGAEPVDIASFDFDSKEFNDAVNESIKLQEKIEQLKNSSTDEVLNNTICTI